MIEDVLALRRRAAGTASRAAQSHRQAGTHPPV